MRVAIRSDDVVESLAFARAVVKSCAALKELINELIEEAFVAISLS